MALEICLVGNFYRKCLCVILFLEFVCLRSLIWNFIFSMQNNHTPLFHLCIDADHHRFVDDSYVQKKSTVHNWEWCHSCFQNEMKSKKCVDNLCSILECMSLYVFWVRPFIRHTIQCLLLNKFLNNLLLQSPKNFCVFIIIRFVISTIFVESHFARFSVSPRFVVAAVLYFVLVKFNPIYYTFRSLTFTTSAIALETNVYTRELLEKSIVCSHVKCWRVPMATNAACCTVFVLHVYFFKTNSIVRLNDLSTHTHTALSIRSHL